MRDKQGRPLLVEADLAELEPKVLAAYPRIASGKVPSPTKVGNIKCMDCRCHGYGCPGMPPGYEAALMREWD